VGLDSYIDHSCSFRHGGDIDGGRNMIFDG
jgi:hypothetical protein